MSTQPTFSEALIKEIDSRESNILLLLIDDRNHSVFSLADKLDTSHEVVISQLKGLLNVGVPIIDIFLESPSLDVLDTPVLENGVTLLNKAKIQSQLSVVLSENLHHLDVLQITPSTSTAVLERDISLRKMSVCITENQSKGRGRRGNDWNATPYRNITLSLSWGFTSWPSTVSGLGLAVSLVVAECLNKEYGAKVSIKWPNDLMSGAAKLGGILIDVTGNPNEACKVVIGIGININQLTQDTSNDYQWQDLTKLNIEVDRNILIPKILEQLHTMLVEFEVGGFEQFLERWNALNSFANQQVKLINNTTEEIVLNGNCEGVDSIGALIIVDDKHKRHSIIDSSLSLRLAN